MGRPRRRPPPDRPHPPPPSADGVLRHPIPEGCTPAVGEHLFACEGAVVSRARACRARSCARSWPCAHRALRLARRRWRPRSLGGGWLAACRGCLTMLQEAPRGILEEEGCVDGSSRLRVVLRLTF